MIMHNIAPEKFENDPICFYSYREQTNQECILVPQSMSVKQCAS